MRKIAILFLLLVIAVLLSGCTSETPTVKDGGDNQTQPQPNLEDNSGMPSQPQNDVPSEITLDIGETAKTSKLEVTVKSVEKMEMYEYCSNLGGQQYCNIQSAKEGNEYYVLQVEVKNVGSDRVYFSASNFSASDSEGNRYDVEALNLREDKIDLFQELYQNQKTSGSIVIEVPKNASGVKIFYDFGDIITGTKLATWEVK